MIAADAAFRNAANAAAAAFAQAPPYVAYRTDATVDVPSLRRHKVISRTVETRTRDDYAVLQDLPKGQRQYAHSFPLIPTFDAISYFRLEYNGDRRDALSYVQMQQPITFTDPRATSHSDVVVVSLKYYHATYAPDSTDALLHVVMDPLPSLTRGNDSDFYLHDVYIDAGHQPADAGPLHRPGDRLHLRLRHRREPLAGQARRLQRTPSSARCTWAG